MAAQKSPCLHCAGQKGFIIYFSIRMTRPLAVVDVEMSNLSNPTQTALLYSSGSSAYPR